MLSRLEISKEDCAEQRFPRPDIPEDENSLGGVVDVLADGVDGSGEVVFSCNFLAVCVSVRKVASAG